MDPSNFHDLDDVLARLERKTMEETDALEESKEYLPMEGDENDEEL